MTVEFMDLGRLHDSIRPEIDSAVAEVIRDSSFVGGPKVAHFEAAFGRAHGLAPGVGCASGTDALILALRALGVGEGDEVIVPAMTFVATAEAVVHAGALPVLADVDAVTLLLDGPSVEAVRTERTKAVIPVHLYGHVVPFDLLKAWRDSGLLVIEDAAQAHLAQWHGRFVGSVGHAACFSFYPGKNLGAMGDGGMVLSPDVALISRIRMMADHGRHSKHLHEMAGWCSRLDGLQAAVLDVKLNHLPSWTASRRALAALYNTSLPGQSLVPWEEGAVHHLLVIRVSDRERVRNQLQQAGIGTGVHYPLALSQQPWLRGNHSSPTPVAEAAAGTLLSLPMDPLMSPKDVGDACEALRGATELARR